MKLNRIAFLTLFILFISATITTSNAAGRIFKPFTGLSETVIKRLQTCVETIATPQLTQQKILLPKGALESLYYSGGRSYHGLDELNKINTRINRLIGSDHNIYSSKTMFKRDSLNQGKVVSLADVIKIETIEATLIAFAQLPDNSNINPRDYYTDIDSLEHVTKESILTMLFYETSPVNNKLGSDTFVTSHTGC